MLKGGSNPKSWRLGKTSFILRKKKATPAGKKTTFFKERSKRMSTGHSGKKKEESLLTHQGERGGRISAWGRRTMESLEKVKRSFVLEKEGEGGFEAGGGD